MMIIGAVGKGWQIKCEAIRDQSVREILVQKKMSKSSHTLSTPKQFTIALGKHYTNPHGRIGSSRSIK